MVLSTGEVTVDKMDIIETLSVSYSWSMFERDEKSRVEWSGRYG